MNNTIKPRKGAKLLQSDREDVRTKFREPLVAEAERTVKLARAVISKRIYEDAFTVEERKAMKVLAAGGYVQGTTYRYIAARETKTHSDGRQLPVMGPRIVNFEGASCLTTGLGSVFCAAALLEEYDAIDKAHDDRTKAMGDLVRELNSVLLSAKTRTELAILWPPIETLMGSAWVNWQAEPNTLPALSTDNITAAMERITALAA